MPATGNLDAFRSALILECDAGLQPRLTVLLEVSRVYCHAFLCPKCRAHSPRIAAVLADVAKAVGVMIHGWKILGVGLEDVAPARSHETGLLLCLCRESIHIGDDEPAEIEWRTALGLGALAVAMAVQRTSENSVAPTCLSGR